MNNAEFVFEGETLDTSCDKNGEVLVVSVGERKFEFTPVGDNLFATNALRDWRGRTQRHLLH